MQVNLAVNIRNDFLGSCSVTLYTLIQTKLFDFYTLSQSRLPENHILHNSAYPYSLCMVVPQGSIRVDINQVLAQLDCALCYPVSEQKKFRYEIRKVA